MTRDERLLSLWTDGGRMSEGMGPEGEWDPVDPGTFQDRHNRFWKMASDMIPDNEADEPFWMTERATAKLKSNN